MNQWAEPLLAYSDTGGASNGETEAVNGVIELHRRIAQGFRNRTTTAYTASWSPADSPHEPTLKSQEPDYPIWTFPVEPDSTRDITAARTHAFPSLCPAAAKGLPTLANKGYTGAGIGIHTPIKGHNLDRRGLGEDSARQHSYPDDMLGCMTYLSHRCGKVVVYSGSDAIVVVLIMALVGSASACTRTPSRSASTRTTTSSSSQQRSPLQLTSSILLNAADRTRLRDGQASLADTLTACSSRVASYQAKPVADLSPGPHYSATGTNAPDPVSKTLEADSQQAYRFALCYVVDGDVKYATRAQEIIDAWATTLKSASTISGKDNLAFFMTPMTPAASWVRGVNGWNGTKYALFLKTVGLPNTKPVMAHQHNHGLWGVWYQSSAAAYLGDTSLLTQTQTRWQALMKEETAADGTLTNEIQRSATSNYTGGADKGKKGLAYTNYALLPATLAAKTFADQSKPVWDTLGGTLLGKAYAKASGWIINPKTFPFYARNNGQLEGVTTASYAAILQQHYPNPDGAQILKKNIVTGDGYLLTRIFPDHLALSER